MIPENTYEAHERGDVTIMCDVLVPSPLDPGQQLACFRRPHPDDPWHWDNRGLGVWFRLDGERVDARMGEARRPEDAPEVPARHRLPVPWTDAVGRLDVDTLRALAPEVRAGLIDSLRRDATELRAGRGAVVVPEDTYDLVRRLVAAEEVCRQWAQAFTDAAREAAALVAEEAATANGEQDGVPNGSLFVPDGVGQRIAVRNDWAPGDSTWDVGSLVGWLIEDEASDYGVNLTEDEGGWSEKAAKDVARGVVARLIGLDGMPGLGKYAPGARAIDNLRKKLSELGRDSEAAVIRQVRSVGPRVYQGMKITREEA